MNANIEQVARWVRQHGHDVVVSDGAAHVKVEWTNVNTGEQGSESIACRNMTEARAAIGY